MQQVNVNKKNKYALVPLGYEFNSKKLNLDNTVNPIDKLTFFTSKIGKKSKTPRAFALYCSMILVISSFTLNSFYKNALDPILLNGLSTLNNVANNTTTYFSLLTNKPFLITVGSFTNFEQAKNKAIELLPELKQIDIIELEDGSFAFQIARLRNENSAIKLAHSIEKSGLNNVQVSYIN